MADISLSQRQKQVQSQIQKMSQKQIMAVHLIGMNNLELRDEIYRFAEVNPALEIENDLQVQADSLPLRKKSLLRSDVHTGLSGRAGKEQSDNYQKMLESSVDNRETLQEHLLSQLRASHLEKEEEDFCAKLIENLDENGWHFLAPESFLDKNKVFHNSSFLKKCLKIVQSFDPVGCCVKNAAESLLVQSEQKENRPELVKFILNGHLELISPPETEKVLKKMTDFLKKQEKLSFLPENEILKKNLITEENIAQAIDFIRNLNPFPAREFGSSLQNAYISSDVKVSVENGSLSEDDFEKGLVKVSSEKDSDTKSSEGDIFLKVTSLSSSIPKIKISSSFEGEIEQKDMALLKSQAEEFIEGVDFRNKAVLKTFSILVSLQKEFFVHGPEKLLPLTQKKLSEVAKIHESTVSRFANSKFIQCDWGTFPVKYFFSSAVKVRDNSSSMLPPSSSSTVAASSEEVSSSAVKIAIEKILEEHRDDKKKISDQKIADILLERGIKIARRTVQKYRSQLDIRSSYER